MRALERSSVALCCLTAAASSRSGDGPACAFSCVLVVGTVIFASKVALWRALGMEGDAPPVSVYQNDAGDEI